MAIIGGGITGLTAGFCLKRKGVPVTLYEAGHRVGGVIESIREEGYLAEFGPNTILETSPGLGSWCGMRDWPDGALTRLRRRRRATWCAIAGR